MSYQLLDSGHLRKFEQFGDFRLVRPCSQALWHPLLAESEWKQADAIFSREEKDGWRFHRKLPPSWTVRVEDLLMKISLTDFGHVGVFPEHALLWRWLEKRIRGKQAPTCLNLFAYSGGASLVMARAGAKVCHLDASKGMISWARENAALNKMEKLPIRWIAEDVIKFLKREQRRGSKYDGILLDPPSFGRGSKGEVFKIEENLAELLLLCRSLLTSDPLFFILSSHTPGMTPLVMQNLLSQTMQGYKGSLEAGELYIESTFNLPSGAYVAYQSSKS